MRNFSPFQNYSIFASRTDRYKRSFFPQLLGCGTTSVMIYVVLIPLVLLRKLYSPLIMYLFTTLLLILLLIDLMQFSTLVYRLDTCALNYYLFKIGCKESPACFCGFYNVSVKHFFLECPLYSAQRTNLLSSAARIFADRWSSMSKAQIVSVFLFGSKLLSPKQNSGLFFHVQSFISDSKRFYKRT